MDTSKTENDIVVDTNETGETDTENISIPKKDYDTLNQTLGSFKKQIKDLKKVVDDTKNERDLKKDKPDENKLLQKLEKMSLRSAGITHADDEELARNTAKKWNMDLDDVLSDEDFKAKLQRQQISRANVEATSGIKGDKGNQSDSKFSPEYWLAKGVYPTKAEVSDRATRTKIREAMIAQAKGSNKKFYND